MTTKEHQKGASASFGGWVCWWVAVILVPIPLPTVFFYGPLFLVSLILAIVAIAQGRTGSGITLVLFSVAGIPIAMAIGLAMTYLTLKSVGVADSTISVGNKHYPFWSMEGKWKKRAAESVGLLDFEWRATEAGDCLSDCTITNASGYAVKNFLVEMNFFDEAGAKVETLHRGIHERIAPGGSVTFSNMTMGSVSREAAACSARLKDFDIVPPVR